MEDVYLYNSLTREKEKFVSLKRKSVGLYACGPTVYWHAHIGNLRTYIFEDVLRRVLAKSGYKIKHIINITDVGHLTSDEDCGEDKMEKGARREKKTVWEIAKIYTESFKESLKKLNIISPDKWIKATDTIKEQIDLIKKLEEKGFTYTTSDGVYFNTSKLYSYGKLWPGNMELKEGVRVACGEKKNSKDFALWKFSPKEEKRQMEWNSPWGVGFPGWHTECVVMATKELGIPIDIHCGGVDHILVHHTNEIAQAEAAFGKNLARFWIHGEHLILKEGKMAKSAGNIITMNSLTKKGYSPLAFRYFVLSAHYRSKLTFSWEALRSAENGLKNIYDKVAEIRSERENKKSKNSENSKAKSEKYIKSFFSAARDDLNIPRVLAILWEVSEDKDLANKDKYSLILKFDNILGLKLNKIRKVKVPRKISKLLKKREELRKKGEFKEADKIRERVEEEGFALEDCPEGCKVRGFCLKKS